MDEASELALLTELECELELIMGQRIDIHTQYNEFIVPPPYELHK